MRGAPLYHQSMVDCWLKLNLFENVDQTGQLFERKTMFQTTQNWLERRKFSDRKDQGFKGESMRKSNLPTQPCKESVCWFPTE